MTEPETPDDDPRASLDDPDWVDRIVARAMENAEQVDEPEPQADPAPRLVRPTAEAVAPRRSQPAGEPVAQPRSSQGLRGAAASQRSKQPDPGAERDPTGDRPAPADSDRGRQVAATAVATVARDSSVFDQDADAPLPIVTDDSDAKKQAARNRALVEWIAVIVGAIAVAFLVKTFLVQAFFIPSSSMEPTLQVNDRVLVNKLSYDFNDPGRGDLVVFEKPDNLVSETDDLIKRIVGLPGETLELIDGRVYIDGRGLNEPYVREIPTNWLGFDATARELCSGENLCVIPEGYVFVMGDNRTGSTDSRRFGPIREDTIVGRAFLRIWPLNDVSWL